VGLNLSFGLAVKGSKRDGGHGCPYPNSGNTTAVSVQFPGGLRTLTEMTEYKKYRRKQVAEMRPYKDGDDLNGVSISNVDHDAGSPKPGDMIARNPKNHTDKWLVAAKYFADNFEAV